MSKYTAYISPFVIYYVFVMLSERYFKDIYIMNPKEWIVPENYWPGKHWGIMLFILILTFIIMILNDVVIERRVNEL
ncbi:MAG: hypothetical protein GX974_06520 [Clostridiales bacterium]|nr:hypothetical protein [Clostridiales bacterium]